MPIQNTYRDSKSKLNPKHLKEKYHKNYHTIIVTFQIKTLPGLLENKQLHLLEDVYFGSSYRKNEIYEINDLDGTLFFVCPISAPMAVGMLEEISYVMGLKNIIMFGSCGTLEKKITSGKIIVPTKAYRDEGTSYHYMPATDFIDVTNHRFVEEILTQYHIDMVKGPVWTTDAFYRETESIIKERKSQGCIAVDMEVSAVQAFANLRKLNFYNFLYSADNLDSIEWENRLLGKFSSEDRIAYFFVAKKIAERLANGKTN